MEKWDSTLLYKIFLITKNKIKCFLLKSYHLGKQLQRKSVMWCGEMCFIYILKKLKDLHHEHHF